MFLTVLSEMTSLNEGKKESRKGKQKLDRILYRDTHTNPTINEKVDTQKNICDDKISEYEKALQSLETCKEAVDKVQEKKSDFRKSCGAFSSGATKCFEAIETCDKCPDGENFGAYDCVFIHRQTKCPAQAGAELEETKEKRKELEEEIKNLKSDIEDKEKERLSKEEELKDALTEIENNFTKITRDLETKTEGAKDSLERGLRKGKGQIEGSLAKNMAAVQKQIDAALKIAHSFENAIYKANREYRKEKREIRNGCESQAKSSLAKFRKRRRAAIQTGSLSYSLSSFLKKGRVSFAQRDHVRFQKYYRLCLSRKKEDFKEVRQDYQQKLRVIDQQKQQYLEMLDKQKNQLAILNQQAHRAGNQLLQDYTKEMDKTLARHNKAYKEVIQDYNKKKSLIASQSNSLSLLDQQIQRTAQTLRGKQETMLREQEIITYLKNKGVPSEDSRGDKTGEFEEAAGYLADLRDSIEIASTTCACDSADNDNNPNHRKCIELDQARSSVDPDSSSDTTIDRSYFKGRTGKR